MIEDKRYDTTAASFRMGANAERNAQVLARQLLARPGDLIREHQAGGQVDRHDGERTVGMVSRPAFELLLRAGALDATRRRRLRTDYAGVPERLRGFLEGTVYEDDEPACAPEPPAAPESDAADPGQSATGPEIVGPAAEEGTQAGDTVDVRPEPTINPRPMSRVITLPPVGESILQRDLAELVGITPAGISYHHQRLTVRRNPPGPNAIVVDDRLLAWLASRGVGTVLDPSDGALGDGSAADADVPSAAPGHDAPGDALSDADPDAVSAPPGSETDPDEDIWTHQVARGFACSLAEAVGGRLRQADDVPGDGRAPEPVTVEDVVALSQPERPLAEALRLRTTDAARLADDLARLADCTEIIEECCRGMTSSSLARLVHERLLLALDEMRLLRSQLSLAAHRAERVGF